MSTVYDSASIQSDITRHPHIITPLSTDIEFDARNQIIKHIDKFLLHLPVIDNHDLHESIKHYIDSTLDDHNTFYDNVFNQNAFLRKTEQNATYLVRIDYPYSIDWTLYDGRDTNSLDE